MPPSERSSGVAIDFALRRADQQVRLAHNVRIQQRFHEVPSAVGSRVTSRPDHLRVRPEQPIIIPA